MRLSSVFLAGLCLVSIASFALEENVSKVSIGEAVKNKKFEEDRRISDLEMKAQAGSLSRYSLKFDLSFAGPPIDNLSDPEMPNPDNRPRNNRTSLGGFMGLRYRVDSNQAVNVSTGFKWLSPYQQMAGEKVNKRPNEKDYEIANPQISYDRTYAAGATQMRTSISGSRATADYYVERGQQASVGISQGVKWIVFQSRWTLGGSIGYDAFFFDRAYQSKDGRLSRQYINLIPSIEYRILKNLNFRASVAYGFSNMRMTPSWWDYASLAGSARAGVGWGITRDVYFNPYISFFSEKPAIHTSSLSFSTVFSIF